MKVLFLLNQPYPNGYALTKRFHLYAKGLLENGISVKILIPKPTGRGHTSLNKSTNGLYEGVEFEYLWKKTTRSNCFFMRRWHDFFGVFRTGVYIAKSRPHFIVTSTFSFSAFLYWKLISLLFSVKFIREKNEVDHHSSASLSKQQFLKTMLINRLFDGFVFISQQLQSFYEYELKVNKPSIIVPILAYDFKLRRDTNVTNNLVYTGTYVERKDGIITLLEAYALVCKKHDDLIFILTGSPEKSPDYQNILYTINQHNLQDKVKFTGYLGEKDLKQLLINARVLLITKPENRQNIYNFPTKLGEYLMTGRPVLTTKVGAVGELLTDKVNVFFSDYTPKAIASNVEYIINNEEKASKVGMRGKEFALNHFNYVSQSKRIISFLNSMKRL